MKTNKDKLNDFLGIGKDKKEIELYKWISENIQVGENIFGNIALTGIEVSLFPAMTALSKDSKTNYQTSPKAGNGCIGRIDYLLRTSRANYCVECKGLENEGFSKFWDSLKVVGYTEYFNWYYDKNYKPAILIPMCMSEKLEIFLVCNKLKITVFGFEKVGHKYLIKQISYKN